MAVPSYVVKIVNTLKVGGYQTYLVGGCVRDLLMGREPKDYDIATEATPDQIIGRKLFSRIIPTGLKHGTVTVLMDEGSCEVTTFRSDGDYSDFRRPDLVEFTTDISEDLSRRDFTINAMALNLDWCGRVEKVIDPFKGINDLYDKQVKAVGSPYKRFSEDPLRMMRAVRFVCQFGFCLDPKTFSGIEESADLIKMVSWERIRDELSLILLSDFPSRGLKALQRSGILKFILPELDRCVGFDQKNPRHNKDVFEHTLKTVESSPKDLVVRLAALFHDIAKPDVFTLGNDGKGHFYEHHVMGYELSKEIMKRFKYDNLTIDRVSTLVLEHMSRFPKVRRKTVKKLMKRVGEENLEPLFQLQEADIKASSPPFDFSEIKMLREEVKSVLDAEEPLSVKDLDVNGHDLIGIGVVQGRDVGEVLNKLLEEVLGDSRLNQRDVLLSLAKEYYFTTRKGEV